MAGEESEVAVEGMVARRERSVITPILSGVTWVASSVATDVLDVVAVKSGATAVGSAVTAVFSGVAAVVSEMTSDVSEVSYRAIGMAPIGGDYLTEGCRPPRGHFYRTGPTIPVVPLSRVVRPRM